MTEEEKREIEHVVRNKVVSVDALCKKIQKEMKELEKWLDGLTNKGGGSTI